MPATSAFLMRRGLFFARAHLLDRPLARPLAKHLQRQVRSTARPLFGQCSILAFGLMHVLHACQAIAKIETGAAVAALASEQSLPREVAFPFASTPFFALLLSEVVRDVLAFVGDYDCLHQLIRSRGSLQPPPTRGRAR